MANQPFSQSHIYTFPALTLTQIYPFLISLSVLHFLISPHSHPFPSIALLFLVASMEYFFFFFSFLSFILSCRRKCERKNFLFIYRFTRNILSVLTIFSSYSYSYSFPPPPPPSHLSIVLKKFSLAERRQTEQKFLQSL